MRPHAAAVAGPRDHQVVQSRVRHEAKGLKQRPRRIDVQVQALHQQRPARLGHRRQHAPRHGPVPHQPVAGLTHHQTGLDVLVGRQRNSAARLTGGFTPGQAWRTSKGFFSSAGA